MRDTTEHLRVIQEAVVRIMKYASKGHSFFEQDELVQSWMIFHLVIIGEAMGLMPQMFRNLHPEIQWKQFIDMRDALIDRYYDIDQNRVWAMVENDIPSLKANVGTILAEQG